MTDSIKSGISQVASKVTDTASYAMADAKTKDLAKDTVDVNNGQKQTTDFGQPVSNLDNWLKVTNNDRVGPHLLEDQVARERIHRFDHERIPERVVHARGAAAHGHFKLYESAEDVTSAGVLTDTSRTTPVFLRFSTVQGSRGSADTVRDVRGFAVKFYTEEGNWDIVGNDIPVFFIQESIKFVDLIHAVKPEPQNEVPQAQSAHNNFWDFAYMHPEATHMFMWAMSDRGIPRSYRMMQGFGVNTYSLINSKGERNFVKFIFTPELGVHSFVWDEALKIAGQDPDFHRKDLEEAITNGAPAKWKFGIQTIPESKQDDFDFDILDATKVWPENEVPIRYIGELELNRTVDEYFTETEQVAFCTSHIVPGIDYSDDPLLQGRNFSYFDTQLSRLGINWEELPINRPVCPMMNFNRDGQGRHRITKGKVNYWPNRFDAAPPQPASEGGFVSYPQKTSGIKARMLSEKFKEHYNQAQLFFNSMSPIEKKHIISALSFELDHCDEEVVYERLSQRLADIDLGLAQAVAEKVGATVPQKANRPNHGKKAPGLSQLEFMPETPMIKSRRIALLIGPGFDLVSYEAVKAAVAAQGAVPFTIGPNRAPIKSKQGKTVKADHHYQGQRSTMFDALFIPDGSHAAELGQQGLPRFWVREAFGHLKPIGAVGDGVKLVQAALAEVPDHKVATAETSGVVDWYGVITANNADESSLKQTVNMVKGAKDFTSAFFYTISQHRNWDRELDGLADMVAC